MHMIKAMQDFDTLKSDSNDFRNFSNFSVKLHR